MAESKLTAETVTAQEAEKARLMRVAEARKKLLQLQQMQMNQIQVKNELDSMPPSNQHLMSLLGQFFFYVEMYSSTNNEIVYHTYVCSLRLLKAANLVLNWASWVSHLGCMAENHLLVSRLMDEF